MCEIKKTYLVLLCDEFLFTFDICAKCEKMTPIYYFIFDTFEELSHNQEFVSFIRKVLAREV